MLPGQVAVAVDVMAVVVTVVVVTMAMMTVVISHCCYNTELKIFHLS